MLNNVRCSFITLGEPEYYGGQKSKPTDKRRWSATALIPADSPLRKQVDAMIEETAKEKWEKKWQTVMENVRADPKACCLVDGKRKDYEGYAGHWALTAHRNEDKGRPLVFDSDKSPIYKPNNELYEGKAGRIYSGCYVNMQIEFWPQDNNNGKAVRATLLGIQRKADGDAFSGGVAPDESAFEEITEGGDADDLS
jgi:hypothetical protein